MPTRSRDLQQGNTGADEQVQAQRERLRQAFLGRSHARDKCAASENSFEENAAPGAIIENRRGAAARFCGD